MHRPQLVVLTAALAVTAAGFASPLDLNTVLAKNRLTTLTIADYQAELQRIPPELRGGFVARKERASQLLNNLLTGKTLAAQAREMGLDKDPLIQRRMQLEAEKVLAQARIEALEKEANTEFESKKEQLLARAKELYLVDQSKYKVPAQVSASHVLIKTEGRTQEEALRIAKEVHAKAKAGTPFEALAKQYSDDAATKERGGALGYFAEGRMVEAFSKAAFALEKEGDISEPVLTQFGYHIIRLSDKKAAHTQSFDEVKDTLLNQQKEKYIADARASHLQKIHTDPQLEVNQPALDSLQVQVDHQELKKANQPVQPVIKPKI